jgi:hypothetical protein
MSALERNLKSETTRPSERDLAASKTANAAANAEANAGEEQEDPMEEADTVSGPEKGDEGDIDSDKEFKKLKRQAARKQRAEEK